MFLGKNYPHSKRKMSYTKRQFVTAAFQEIGLADYVFDLQPEDLQNAVRRLDSMLAEWNGKGIRISFPLPSSPELTDLDTESNVPDYANEAIITGLAVRIAPSYGKQVSRESKIIARQAYNTVLQRSTTPPQMQFPSQLPRGAGQKPWRYGNSNPFFGTPADPVQVGPDGDLELF